MPAGGALPPVTAPHGLTRPGGGRLVPASVATVGTAARAAPRARKERRFVDDMVFPFEETVGQAP
jgi:hypothetical protein